MESEFRERAGRIPIHGLGLSVDVYQPDLMQLVQRLRQEGLQPGYLEIFKATTGVMHWVRQRIPEVKLTYHGEGLWVTQPDFVRTYSGQEGADEACAQVAVLGSAWLNHECAAKQMAGYEFGTYVPPLYTALSARMTAQNLACLQRRLDERLEGKRHSLVLLEMPPLTYFACGSLDIPAFFRSVTQEVACGLVLDIGHLWTVYRYTGAWRTQGLEAFVAEFLDAFPMERVIEIHAAGLAPSPAYSPTAPDAGNRGLPYWVDSHGAPIPDLLFDLLNQVIVHPRLTSLKGVALEVDSKPIPHVVTEYSRFVDRFEPIVRWAEPWSENFSRRQDCLSGPSCLVREVVTSDELARLERQYDEYVQLIAATGSVPDDPDLSLLGGSPEDLDRYRRGYLPHELLHWGGELTDMFPQTCRLLAAADIPLERFIPFWFERPGLKQRDYDFFLLKIDRFAEFAADCCHSASVIARQEAEDLRAAYQAANEPVGTDGVRA